MWNLYIDSLRGRPEVTSGDEWDSKYDQAPGSIWKRLKRSDERIETNWEQPTSNLFSKSPGSYKLKDDYSLN